MAYCAEAYQSMFVTTYSYAQPAGADGYAYVPGALLVYEGSDGIVTYGAEDPCPSGTVRLVTQDEWDSLSGGGADWSITPEASALLAASILGVWAVAWAFRLIGRQISTS